MFRTAIFPLSSEHFVTVVCGILAYLCLLLGYRLYVHPLKRYPGPIWAQIFEFYGAYFAFRKSLHLTTYRDHQKYGPILRQGPNKLVFNTATAFKEIYQNERITKSRLYLLGYSFLKNKSTFVALDKNVHRFKRKLIGQVISDRAIREFEPTMLAQIDIFLSQLRGSKPVNMSERLQYLGVDIIGLLTFGYEYNLQTSSKNQCLLRSLEIYTWYSNVTLQSPYLSWFFHKILLDLVSIHVQIPSFMLLKRMMEKRISEGKDARQDLYSFAVDVLEPEKKNPMDKVELRYEATFFMQAGGDTTATTLSATFFYLSRNRDCYKRLAQEIRSTFSSAAEIRGGTTLSKCHYLRACIDEAMRMSPPVAGTLWRELDPDDTSPEPLIIDGHVIPAGTHVGVNIYSLHHNEEYFPDPFTYNPERWLARDGTHVTHEAFAPFLTGYRGCSGKAMAYLEASLVLAKTLWSFDFERAPGALGKVGQSAKSGQGEKEFRIYDIFTAANYGPYLTFRPREDD
ncbi:cytochrome P450 [Nemania sp. FL0031]|nr:cytochrome P450 [Nemania sp. FL0031]